MRFGLPNRIDVVESSLNSGFYRRIIVDSDFNDLIESTRSIFDINRSIFDINRLKLIVFDIFLIKINIFRYKFDLLINLNQSNVDYLIETVDLYRKRQFISKTTTKIDNLAQIRPFSI